MFAAGTRGVADAERTEREGKAKASLRYAYEKRCGGYSNRPAIQATAVSKTVGLGPARSGGGAW